MFWELWVEFFARGHSDVRTDGEARVSCVPVPEGKTIHIRASKHEVLFLLHAFIRSF